MHNDYATKREILNEGNSAFELLPKGSSEITINLPPDIYTKLRYDIDIFGEWYELKGIYVSESIVKKNNSPIFITLIISIGIFILWIIGIRMLKSKTRN